MTDFLWLVIVWLYSAFFLAVFFGSFVSAGNR
jgi:hypothetical protein